MAGPPSVPNPPSVRRGRAADWLPAIGLLAWAAGAVVVWLVGVRWPRPVGEVLLAEFVWLMVLAVVARDAVRNLFGPVFTYEALRVGRKRSTFVLRGLYVVAMMALLAHMYVLWLEGMRYRGGNYSGATVPPRELSRFATQFFFTFEVLQYLAVVLLTPAYVAGAIADEKERKTLEFLLATDLRNREIVFGKMAARVANLLMYVLAGLPVMAFLQLFGGIDPELLLVGTVVAVVSVLGLSALGTYFSCVLRRPRDAIALTYLVAAVYAVGSFTLGIFLFGMSVSPFGVTVGGYPIADLPWQGAADWVGAGNPAYGIAMVFGNIARGGAGLALIPEYLARFLIFWAVVGVGLIALATGQLRSAALAQPRATSGRRGRAVGPRSRPAVGDDPMFWKEVFAEPGVSGGCAGRLIGGMIVLFTFLVPVLIVLICFGDLIPGLPELFGGRPSFRPFDRRWDDFIEGMNGWVRGATGVLSVMLFLAATVRGAGSVSGERDRDTWITLASTPLGAWEMLAGKWWGCVLGLRPLLTVFLIVWALGLAVGAVPIVMILPTAVALGVYTAAFAWLGILCSVTARTTLIATVRAILAALFIGGGFWMVLVCCCVMPIEYSGAGRGMRGGIETVAQLLAGCTPSFVVGWLPMNEFGRNDLGPFHSIEGELGVMAPVIGLMIWAGLSGVFALLSWEAFRRDSLRTDTARRRRPPPRPRRPADGGGPD